MNKLTVTFLTCLLCIASISAQAGSDRGRRGHEGPSPEQKVERLTEALGLNEQQAASLLDILTATDLERDALREEHESLIRQDACALMISTNDQIVAVLTADQYAQLAEMMERRADHRAEHANSRGKGGFDRPSLADCEAMPESA